jgi:CheY-like chemotaxis protein
MPDRTLLVVEDDEQLRKLYGRVLTAAGFDVREAADGLEALRRIDERAPDAIILDLMLPRVSGFGVLHDLTTQARTRDIPVIVVTGTDEPVSQYPVAAVLRKPVSPEDLVQAVRRWADTGAAGG